MAAAAAGVLRSITLMAAVSMAAPVVEQTHFVVRERERLARLGRAMTAEPEMTLGRQILAAVAVAVHPKLATMVPLAAMEVPEVLETIMIF